MGSDPSVSTGIEELLFCLLVRALKCVVNVSSSVCNS